MSRQLSRKGLSIKDVHSQRGVQFGHVSDKDREVLLQMWTSALFGAKNFGVFEFYGVFPQTRGESEPLRITGEEVNFSRFCADIFYGSP